MKRSILIQTTDAVLYVVLFGAILSVCIILLCFGALIPLIAIPFIAVASGISGILFVYNAIVLTRLYWNNYK